MTKMTENINRCKRCKEWIIAEESLTHRCYERLDIMLFDTDGTFSFDGKKWYRWFTDSPTNLQQPNKTTKDETEPIFSMFLD